MQQSFGQRPLAAPAILGFLLIAVGAVVLLAQEIGFDVFGQIGSWGWPLFIIVPGLLLLVAALLPSPPRGIGFAIAGAIVTTVGGLLLYQSRSGHWESWAYAWALIPMAAGVALIAYGLFSRSSSMVRGGTWMAGIAALMLAIGAWFFEAVFTGHVRPELGEWWPIAIVALGAVIVVRAMFTGDRRRDAAPKQPGTGA